MTIDRDKLVELLVEKTGFTKEQVEGQLSELISRIQNAAGEGKSFEIEGFGTFSMPGGKLNFEPADELKTEINNDYAGMEPIELIGANKEEPVSDTVGRKEEEPEEEDPFPGLEEEGKASEEEESPTPVEPESASEEEVEDIDAELDEILGISEAAKKSASGLGDELSKARSEKSKEKEEDVPAGEAVPAPEAPEEEDVPFLGLEEEMEPEEEPATEDTEPEEEPIELDEEPVAETAGPIVEAEKPVAEEGKPVVEAGEPPRKTKWEPAPELKRAKKAPVKKEKNDTIGSVLIVSMIIIVLGVGGWFAYEMGLLTGTRSSGGGGQTAAQQAPQPASQQQQSENGGTAAGQQEPPAAETEPAEAEPPGSEPSEGNEVAEEESSQSPVETATYGLMGSVNPDANDGYTIVIHSMRSRVAAEAVESRFVEEGYRTLLMGAVVNGNRFWRVGIGQFETVGTAQAATGNLPEPYNSENFIRRIDN